MNTSSQDTVHLPFCRIILFMFFFCDKREYTIQPLIIFFSIETNLVAPLTIRTASCCFHLSLDKLLQLY